MGIKKVIARNVLWNWAGTLCDAGIAFVIAPFLVHRLGGTTYGLWVLIGSVSNYFGFLDLGVRGSVGRYIAYHRAEGDQRAVNSTLSTALAICCAAAALVLAMSVGVQALFLRAFDVPPDQAGSVRFALGLVCLNLALFFPLSLFDGTLWASQRFDIINAIDIPISFARAVITYWLVVRGYGLVGLAWITLLTTVLAGLTKAIASFWQDPGLRIHPAYITRDAARPLFGYGIVSLVISVVGMTRVQMSPMLIGALLSPAAVTLYSIARRLIDYTASLLVSATSVLRPVATVLQAQGESARQHSLLVRGGRFASAFSLYFVISLLLLGRSLITLWIGPEWSRAATILSILALGEALPLSQTLTWNLLMGLARLKPLAYLAIAELGAVVVLAFVLMAMKGVVGLCIALALPAAVCRGVMLVAYGCRAVGVPVRVYLQQAVLPALAAAMLPALGLAAVMTLGAPDRWPRFLVYCVIYGVLCVVATLLLSGPDLLRVALGRASSPVKCTIEHDYVSEPV